MKSKFVVAIAEMTNEQSERFVGYIKEKGFGWWHWINNYWLIVSSDGNIGCDEIRGKILEIAPSHRCLIIKVGKDAEWCGFGPNQPPKDMFEWLHKNWVD